MRPKIGPSAGLPARWSWPCLLNLVLTLSLALPQAGCGYFRDPQHADAGTASTDSAADPTTTREIPDLEDNVARTVNAVPGQPVVFSIRASGVGLSFQWLRDDVPIPGATDSSFTLLIVTPADDGAVFTVRVRNAQGATTSQPFTLHVATAAVAPSILTPPADLSTEAGQPAVFAVIAEGTPPFSYQWLRNNEVIPGAQTERYTIPVSSSDDDGARFSVRVGNVSGVLVTSAAATLSVRPQPGLYLVAGSAGGRGRLAGIGTSARFAEPVGLARDPAGNVYVADEANHTIFRIAPNLRVSIVAGRGEAGQDDGPAATATFNMPSGVVVDSHGNLFVVDSGSATVRRITPAGVVSTFAGVAGDSAWTDGPAGTGRLYTPKALTIDPDDNLYVAGIGGVRRIDPAGTISSVAGSAATGDQDGVGAAASFDYLRGIARAADGTLFVSDYGADSIRRISPTGDVTTVAGSSWNSGAVDGVGAGARFSQPQGIALDSSGNLFVADTNNQTVRRVSPEGNVTTVAGMAGVTGPDDGPAHAASFRAPSGLLIDPTGQLLITEVGNSQIRRLDALGTVTTLAGQALRSGYQDAHGDLARFSYPFGVAVTPTGGIVVADLQNAVLRLITRLGDVSTLAGLQGAPGMADGPAAAARFMAPFRATADTAGNIYIADMVACTIRRLGLDGQVTTVAGQAGDCRTVDGPLTDARLGQVVDVAVDPAGNVSFLERAHVIRRISTAGQVSTLAGAFNTAGYRDGPGSTALFNAPISLAALPDGDLLVADASNMVIRRVSPAGEVSTVAGQAGHGAIRDGLGTAAAFMLPTAVRVGSHGVAYVADQATLRRITPAGEVSTIAGAGDGQMGVGLGPLPGHLPSVTYGLAIDPRDERVVYLSAPDFVLRAVLP